MLSIESLKSKQEKICVVGLGYVGLPLAARLAKNFSVIGFDVNEKRVAELKQGIDRTKEVEEKELKEVAIEYSTDPKSIARSKFIIVAVPTPVDSGNIPDLTLVEKATSTVGQNLTKDSVVVYESTVYPGVTEDVCAPLLEKMSGLKAGSDFKVGYSPERVNPGDKEHTIDRVTKVVSGMDQESLELTAEVYGSITKVFKAASIKVAEAAKVIENTQRDLNIALMNELAVIFSQMGFSVYDVLRAAGTKWNFLKFKPGLVGGHCIGVDPYYLTYKAQTFGYHPQVILAGRRINDSMGAWMVQEIMKSAVKLGKNVSSLNVLIAGMTFKENVSDIRNSKVFDIYQELARYGIKPFVHDPYADKEDVKHEYGVELCDLESLPKIDLLIMAVAHEDYKNKSLSEWKKILGNGCLIADVKGLFERDEVEKEGMRYWSL